MLHPREGLVPKFDKYLCRGADFSNYQNAQDTIFADVLETLVRYTVSPNSFHFLLFMMTISTHGLENPPRLRIIRPRKVNYSASPKIEVTRPPRLHGQK